MVQPMASIVLLRLQSAPPEAGIGFWLMRDVARCWKDMMKFAFCCAHRHVLQAGITGWRSARKETRFSVFGESYERYRAVQVLGGHLA